jgi:phosphoribosylformimino-5-aminoimidazole carboxamide ribotide isomerase
MLVIPAIDIKQGRCVRLLQGEKDRETVFSDDPAAMAARWQAQGAELLHVVDLDGAFEGNPKNLEAIKTILATVDIPVQLGGGIRNMDTVTQYLEMGASRVILGTEAIRKPNFVHNACRAFPQKIIVGIDARDGMVAVDGWTKTTRRRAVDIAKGFEGYGLRAIVFTDIRRDGMQSGTNIEQTMELARAVSISIIASGGVSTIEDIAALLPLEKLGVEGVITGRAIYTGSLDLKKAIETARTPIR